MGTSYRRRLLDRHLAQACANLQGTVLDLGGGWLNRRGTFRPPQRRDLRWICVNLNPRAAPDVVGDVMCVPLTDGCADTVVCTEVMEHVYDPGQLLREATRVLQPGGQLIASIPFMSRIHADPHDYQRYTATKLRNLLSGEGFRRLNIQAQGLYLTVLADMVRGGLARTRPALVRWTLSLLVIPVLNLLIHCEERAAPSAFIASHVAGYFIIAQKPD